MIIIGSAGHEVLIYAGIGGIITSALLFVIINLSIDLHKMEYNLSILTETVNKIADKL